MMLPRNFMDYRAQNNGSIPPSVKIWKELNLVTEMFDEGSE